MNHMTQTPVPKKSYGLGGWLLAVAAMLFITLFRTPFIVWYIFVNERLTRLLLEADLPMLQVTDKLTAVSTVLFAAVTLWVTVLFFQKKKTFPKAFTIFSIASLVFWTFEVSLEIMWRMLEAANYTEQNTAATIVGVAVAAGVHVAFVAAFWLYVRRSKRVKATFVR